MITRPRSDLKSADSVKPAAIVSSTNFTMAAEDMARTIAAVCGAVPSSMTRSSTFST